MCDCKLISYVSVRVFTTEDRSFDSLLPISFWADKKQNGEFAQLTNTGN